MKLKAAIEASEEAVWFELCNLEDDNPLGKLYEVVLKKLDRESATCQMKPKRWNELLILYFHNTRHWWLRYQM